MAFPFLHGGFVDWDNGRMVCLYESETVLGYFVFLLHFIDHFLPLFPNNLWGRPCGGNVLLIFAVFNEVCVITAYSFISEKCQSIIVLNVQLATASVEDVAVAVCRLCVWGCYDFSMFHLN